MTGQAVQFGKRLAAAAAIGGYAFKRMFVDVAAGFERSRFALNAMTGSKEKGGKAFANVQKFAMNTPFTFEDSMEVYKKLKAGGVEPLKGKVKPMQALADGLAFVGGTSVEFRDLGRQLGQMVGKGKILAQDANSFIDRGINPYRLLVDWVKENKNKTVSMAEMRKLGEDGELGQGAVNAFLEQLQNSTKGAAKEYMKSWDGMISNMKDLWARFVLFTMESGTFQFLKTELRALLTELNAMVSDGRMKTYANQLGESFLFFLGAAKKAFFTVKSIVDALAPAFIWIEEHIGTANALFGAMAVIIGGKLLYSIIMIQAAFAMAGVAMSTALVIPAIVISAVAALGYVAYYIIEQWSVVEDSFVKMWDAIGNTFTKHTDLLKSQFTGMIEGIKSDLNAVSNYLENTILGKLLTRGFNFATDVNFGGESGATAMLSPGGGELHVVVKVESDRAGVKSSVEKATGISFELDQGYSGGFFA